MVATLSTTISASLAAFGFARIRFPGRDFLFVVLLSTMMLPDIVTLIPKYILFSRLHWINTFLPLTVPFWFGGGTWNDFLNPLIYLNTPDRFTLALGLQSYQTLYGTQWARLMAASMLMIAPILVLFFSFQRFFVEGIQLTGLAGR